MLKISDLKVSYGGIEAVKGVSLEVPKNHIVTLIGANGAGKSTILRSIMGLVKADSGDILLDGQSIMGVSTNQIVSSGISLVPEGRRIFPNLTVLENIKIGAYLRKDDLASDIEWVYNLFPILKSRHWQMAGTLSGGEQQMLAVARALMSKPKVLMSKPKVLMMDEPSLGLAPLVIRDIFEIIKTIHQEGMTILLIEQNANLALKCADYGYVLETGNIILEGTGMGLLHNEKIQEAYLGKKK